ncbi:uncharacterized protein BDR25DRAFT_348587 [Lindgomyces ingoldianus]|uniref:Uncharacterized protein n=1 Tax=Lindgomyces ingoldianus TaxID=673940 RepID=A0ACB6RGC8_9PLEO|nr:uncharacterized protein BDR25DRAFT_348587 [Lindgomyces ingoldianus]KAF2478333.1 hypothetical protein BDR25DRAFT_348587 [Lindgomyces ingoldianus]
MSLLGIHDRITISLDISDVIIAVTAVCKHNRICLLVLSLCWFHCLIFVWLAAAAAIEKYIDVDSSHYIKITSTLRITSHTFHQHLILLHSIQFTSITQCDTSISLHRISTYIFHFAAATSILYTLFWSDWILILCLVSSGLNKGSSKKKNTWNILVYGWFCTFLLLTLDCFPAFYLIASTRFHTLLYSPLTLLQFYIFFFKELYPKYCLHPNLNIIEQSFASGHHIHNQHHLEACKRRISRMSKKRSRIRALCISNLGTPHQPLTADHHSAFQHEKGGCIDGNEKGEIAKSGNMNGSGSSNARNRSNAQRRGEIWGGGKQGVWTDGYDVQKELEEQQYLPKEQSEVFSVTSRKQQQLSKLAILSKSEAEKRQSNMRIWKFSPISCQERVDGLGNKVVGTEEAERPTKDTAPGGRKKELIRFGMDYRKQGPVPFRPPDSSRLLSLISRANFHAAGLSIIRLLRLAHMPPLLSSAVHVLRRIKQRGIDSELGNLDRQTVQDFSKTLMRASFLPPVRADAHSPPNSHTNKRFSVVERIRQSERMRMLYPPCNRGSQGKILACRLRKMWTGAELCQQLKEWRTGVEHFLELRKVIKWS